MEDLSLNGDRGLRMRTIWYAPSDCYVSQKLTQLQYLNFLYHYTLDATMVCACFNVQGDQVRSKTREIVEVTKKESIRQERINSAARDLAAEEEFDNLPVYEPPTAELVSNSLSVKVRYLVKWATIIAELFCRMHVFESNYAGKYPDYDYYCL